MGLRASEAGVGVPIEDELALLLAGTAARRRAAAGHIVELAGQADYRAFASVLYRQGLAPLLGLRLLEAAPGATPEWFAREVSAVVERGRHRAALFEQTTLRLLALLGEEGIDAIPLKGATLGEELHGDPALRPSTDVDVLVSRAHLERAVLVLRDQGFDPPADLRPVDGLPQLHYTLPHGRGWLPTVEVHWRIHWYEAAFSEALLERSVAAPSGGRRLGPDDGLAALLLFYSRDGLFGLRYPADIAAWWDLYGSQIDPGALDVVVEEHPELRGAIAAAAEAAERVVGLPASQLLSANARGRRGRWASRLVNWSQVGEHDQLGANRSLIDGLLSPDEGMRTFARRQLLLPVELIAKTYRLPPGAGVRLRWWQLAHPPKVLVRYLLALWQIRGGRSWAPLPASAGKFGRSPSVA